MSRAPRCPDRRRASGAVLRATTRSARGGSRRGRGALSPRRRQRALPRTLQVEEELAVAGIAGDRRFGHRWRTNPTSAAARDASSTTRACTAGSRITPFLPTSARPASNCGFTSATTSAPSREERRHSRKDVPQRDERHVDGDDVDGRGQVRRLERRARSRAR